MGIENMRRWPMYIVFSGCILLTLSLLNSWSMETEMKSRISDLSIQVQECSKQQATCMEETMTLAEDRNRYSDKVNSLNKAKSQLEDVITLLKTKVSSSENTANRTIMDLELCKTELESQKDLEVSRSLSLETLRQEKTTLTIQLTDSKRKIEELTQEIEKLKTSLAAKNQSIIPSPSVSSKMSPVAQPPKLSSAALNAIPILKPMPDVDNAKEENSIHEPVLGNNAKEEFEEPNEINSNNDQNDDDQNDQL